MPNLSEEILPFYDVTLTFVQKLNAWIRKTKELSHNTACTTHKTMRSYIMRALDDKYKFDNPYKLNFNMLAVPDAITD